MAQSPYQQQYQYYQQQPSSYQQPSQYYQPPPSPKPSKPKIGGTAIAGMIVGLVGGILILVGSFVYAKGGFKCIDATGQYVYLWLIPIGGILTLIFSIVTPLVKIRALTIIISVFSVQGMLISFAFLGHFMADYYMTTVPTIVAGGGTPPSVGDVFNSLINYGWYMCIVGGTIGIIGGRLLSSGLTVPPAPVYIPYPYPVPAYPPQPQYQAGYQPPTLYAPSAAPVAAPPLPPSEEEEVPPSPEEEIVEEEIPPPPPEEKDVEEKEETTSSLAIPEKCPKCGMETTGKKFCTHCGAKLIKE